jgi:hypothetical protein
VSLDEFRASPWKKSHKVYEESAFNIRPAPEFSTAEVMIASLYRATGYSKYAETEVPKAGREFDRLSLATKVKAGETTKIARDTWRTILHGVLESPKQPNQSSKRFLQLCPIIPDIALYSGSARLAGNSWNPGALIRRMIELGAASPHEANLLWERLFKALSVTDEDDVWARWLQEEFDHRRKIAQEWSPSTLSGSTSLSDGEQGRLRFPAKQFVRDLDAIIDAKSSMTRRQWISLLEAIVRLAAVAHVLWLCRVNIRLWRATSSILGLGDARVPASEEEVRTDIVMGEARYLTYGNPAMPTIRDYASGYLVARAGLNLVLWGLDEGGVTIKGLQSSQDLWKFLGAVKAHKESLILRGIPDALQSIFDDEARTIACKKGIGSNLIEFSRHTLGQRLTSNETLRGYDQSYFLRKRGEARNAPWVLSLGPVAVLAVVHCCLREASGPRSVQRLSDHLSWYGIEVDVGDINSSDLGRQMRMLGLVLDSPDAESGMLLVPPFGPVSKVTS